MDRLVVSLLNTAMQNPDPFETPLGTARWWGSLPAGAALPLAAGKPRFDSPLALALCELRSAVAALLTGSDEALRLRFRGDDADGILFQVAHAVCAAVQNGTIRRIRQCSGQACGHYFLDETKNGSRRWCSLRCMERARAPRRRTISR